MTAKPHQPDFSIHAFKEGEPQAFNYVFDQYYPALRFFATRIIQDATAAEDIAQETFIKLWEKHTGFDTPQRIKAFLYITTRNACFNYIKRAKAGHRSYQQLSSTYDESDDSVLKHLTASEVVREINFVLNMLPPECGKVIRHAYIDGMDNHEIAKHLNISVNTVKNQKARAIYLMRKKLGNRPLFLLALAVLEAPKAHFQLQEDKLLYDTVEVRSAARQLTSNETTLYLPVTTSDLS